MSNQKSDGGGVNTCSQCIWRNPASGYCPKSGVDREETDNACGCFAEFKDAWMKESQDTPGTWNYREPCEESKINIDKIIFKTMETKVCKRCGREFPLESFPACKRAKDGHLSVCKECNSKARSESRPEKRTVHVEEVALFPASTEPAAHPEIMSAIADKTMVEELRKRGWEVTCKRTIVEEL